MPTTTTTTAAAEAAAATERAGPSARGLAQQLQGRRNDLVARLRSWSSSDMAGLLLPVAA